MKTALFLGAGASAFAGQPTTKDLIDLTRERGGNIAGGISKIIEIIINNDNYGDVEKLYDGIDRMLSVRNIPNVKPIFLTLHGSDSTFKKTMDELAYLRAVIRDILLESFTVTSDKHRSIVQMYDMVRSVVRGSGTDWLRIFTTNYDVVVETYAGKKRLEVVNGFEAGYDRLSRIWADNWDRPVDKPPLYLTKLHGSVNWYEDTDGNILEAGGIPQRDAKHDIMIAPTEGAKDYDQEPFPALLKHFEESIKDVDVLLVIGFSYRDEKIVNIIKDRLDDGMVLISVSPTAAADIHRVSNVNIGMVEAGGRAFKTADSGIVLIEREFKPDTIDDVRTSLEAAYGLVRHHAGHARLKGKNTA